MFSRSRASGDESLRAGLLRPWHRGLRHRLVHARRHRRGALTRATPRSSKPSSLSSTNRPPTFRGRLLLSQRTTPGARRLRDAAALEASSGRRRRSLVPDPWRTAAHWSPVPWTTPTRPWPCTTPAGSPTAIRPSQALWRCSKRSSISHSCPNAASSAMTSRPSKAPDTVASMVVFQHGQPAQRSSTVASESSTVEGPGRFRLNARGTRSPLQAASPSAARVERTASSRCARGEQDNQRSTQDADSAPLIGDPDACRARRRPGTHVP